MGSLDKRLKEARTLYDSAMRKLSSGNGNVISNIEKLKDLGARTTKSLPAYVLHEKGENARAEIAP
jgi:DNA recombination protein RmuC